jgi:pimeloyl-ACP methyl ester carboxylesterase/DNA-binding SARP family transcriptional activator
VSATLRVKVLGKLSVTCGDRALELPQSRKTRALLAYLAVTQREHTRDRLCRLLWPDVDDARGALRWSLSKLRVFLPDTARERLLASRDTVAFDGRDVDVDVLRVRVIASGESGPAHAAALQGAAAAFGGELLEGLDVEDAPDYHAWCLAQREEARRLELRVLDRLVEQLRGTPEAAIAYAQRRVQVALGDDERHAQLLSLLAAAGRAREAEQHFRAHVRWLEGHGRKPGPLLLRAWAAVGRSDVAIEHPGDDEATLPAQEIRFCAARDGVRIAYAAAGAGPPLVKAANWLSHLEFDWESPIWRHWMRELCREHRLIRYDERGNGLSDWSAEELSLAAFVADLEAVIDAAGLKRYALLGISQGCAIAIAHAVRHPELVSGLVLYGGYAQGWRLRGDPHEIEIQEAMLTLVAHGWGRPDPTFRQLFTSQFFPGATLAQMNALNELQRKSTSPENAVRLERAFGDLDVSALVRHVLVPTLVLHARDDRVVPFEQGRLLATSIPGARFVPLESVNHVLAEDEPAWQRFRAEVHEFLTSDRRVDASSAASQ